MGDQLDVGVISTTMTDQAKSLQKRGYTIALYSPEDQCNIEADNCINTESLEEFVSVLKQPREIRIELESWKLLNRVFDKLCPLLDDEDLIIDDTPKLHQVVHA
ncbi:MAG: hypothetical protein AAF490_30345 [Chloroflexota bacterium]